MNDERSVDRVRELLARVAEQLERHAEGDALALEALGAVLRDPALSSDDLLAAAWVLRSLENVPWNGVPEVPDLLAAGGATPQIVRVLSTEERESLGPDAWGYLLALRHSGALDAGQFERVVDLLAASGARPVSLSMAREAAASVVLQLDPGAPGEMPYGDLDVAN